MYSTGGALVTRHLSTYKPCVTHLWLYTPVYQLCVHHANHSTAKSCDTSDAVNVRKPVKLLVVAFEPCSSTDESLYTGVLHWVHDWCVQSVSSLREFIHAVREQYHDVFLIDRACSYAPCACAFRSGFPRFPMSAGLGSPNPPLLTPAPIAAMKL